MGRRELDMLTLCVLMTAVVGLTSGQCEDTFPDGTPCGQDDFVQQEDPELCFKYYKCDSGCVTHETCPDNFKYDTLYGFCNYPSDVECGDRPCPDGNVHCPPPLKIKKIQFLIKSAKGRYHTTVVSRLKSDQ